MTGYSSLAGAGLGTATTINAQTGGSNGQIAFSGMPGTSGQMSSSGYPVQQVYVDPETIKQQKGSSLALLENQVALAKDRTKAEYEAEKSSIMMKAEHDLSTTTAAIEQAKTQSLFALDQQHQTRRLEIEQRAQEQRLQIDATASQLIMTAQQQRLQREMEEKLAKLQASVPGPMLGMTPMAGSAGQNGQMSAYPGTSAGLVASTMGIGGSMGQTPMGQASGGTSLFGQINLFGNNQQPLANMQGAYSGYSLPGSNSNQAQNAVKTENGPSPTQKRAGQ